MGLAVRDSYKGKDGIARNLTRYRDEWLDWKDRWKVITKIEQPDSHDPVSNWFVELSRFRPWLGGHLWRNTAIVALVEAGVIAWLLLQ